MDGINNFEKIKMDMVINDYKLGNSWENKFLKKMTFDNLDIVLANYYLELCEEIREQNSASEMED
ncbi:Uncharacterised protein [Anaerococcus prevotii]|uniref:Uncharacterized protein n=2 Tax=Anaerococcus prevotii TaxID=33034 RepID=C7RH79_ANAPD|nr:hypothetical protein [Anaerococcus prevotii]ACV28840.1 hypothetical protein Apre_0812 [Anaerococcus prevotii DSM 20548]SUU94515.1 Uncharacterised protein [Anaerococcus prevotii]